MGKNEYITRESVINLIDASIHEMEGHKHTVSTLKMLKIMVKMIPDFHSNTCYDDGYQE